MGLDREFCPGSKSLREPTPEYLPCANCGDELEIWTDEFKVRCPACGHTTFKERLPLCVEWCKAAEECVGTEAYKRLKNLVG